MNNLSVAQPVKLFQPSDCAIAAITGPLRERWPQLVSRIDRAERILINGGVTIDPVAWNVSHLVNWRVTSQHDPLYHYVIGSTMSCGCGDAMPNAHGERPAPIADVYYCKHALAVAIYRRFLKVHLNHDVRRFNVELAIQPNGQCMAFARNMGIVMVERDEAFPLADGVPGYSFADSASVVRYSLWLQRQEDLHWMATGQARLPLIKFPTFMPEMEMAR